ncbi:arabinose-5-phosphate isomerase [Chitinophaga skermanii]|uniref:Arabinose-5-phosphate isomerase n=1 Tax=Chitinophaga skermanii TaxID=331697 RepID=A0A327Q2Q8_9BACT|nr:KpsF/GutQ family sugar-phosphate isomerase [Chitinophaga skermanii]RAI98639.1 arabinose-5-phosphate isomerase [Chitinophaga skermanii]
MIQTMNVNISATALKTIQLEAAAIGALQGYINEDFEQCVKLLAECTGRVVIAGIGKSAIVAQKIVATLNSTGTPALFMHAADAIHGDLGMIRTNDVVMIISKSGESPEIKVLVPLVKNFGNTLIAIVGKLDSYLAKSADFILNTTVSQEACPNNLAPTSSTTAQMVMGDAVAVCLMEMKGFSASDFAKFHPGGALGKRLYLKVSDLSKLHEAPQVRKQSTIKEVIVEISSKMLGVTAVVDDHKHLEGIITDGDLRRMLEKEIDTADVLAADIMSTKPKTIQKNELAINALEKMRQYNITQLLVMDGEVYDGIIHLHDLIREGII